MKKLLLLITLFSFSLYAAPTQQNFWNTYTAALRGEVKAQYETGVMFEQGLGTDINQSMAVKWYEKAAIQGYKDAQFNLGIMYASGRGVEQNIQFAMMWFASAAKQGDVEARKLLNDIIENKYEQQERRASPQQSNSGKLIKPIRFEIKENGTICSKPDSQSSCKLADKSNVNYTSNRQENGFYKLTGVITPGKGWKDYIGDSWVSEESIEIRR